MLAGNTAVGKLSYLLHLAHQDVGAIHGDPACNALGRDRCSGIMRHRCSGIPGSPGEQQAALPVRVGKDGEDTVLTEGSEVQHGVFRKVEGGRGRGATESHIMVYG